MKSFKVMATDERSRPFYITCYGCSIIAIMLAYPLGFASYRSQDGSDIPSLHFLAYDVSKRSK